MASATAVTSLDGVTSGVGSTVDFTAAVSNVSMVVAVSGTVSDGLVRMQASHNGTAWVTVGLAHMQGGENFAVNFSGGAFRYWRASVRSAVTGGGTVTATFMEAA